MLVAEVKNIYRVETIIYINYSINNNKRPSTHNNTEEEMSVFLRAQAV